MGQSLQAIGIDIGGTKIAIGIVDAEGQVKQKIKIETHVLNGPVAVIEDIAQAVSQLQKEKGIVGAGVGMAAQINKLTGMVQFAPNLGWKNFPLKEELGRRLDLPIWVTNDVRAAAWGEWLYGAGKGSKDFICLFVGTGIGGGVVSEGRMLTGFNNSAGELGHMTVDLHGPVCSCGNHGCFEALASGWAIARRAKEVMAYDPSGAIPLLALVDGDAEKVTAKQVIQALQQGSVLAKKIIEEVKEALIAGSTSIVNAFNPERLILGGGIIQGYPEFIEDIRQGIPLRALKAASEHLEVREAQLKTDAGIIGAAAFAMQASSKKE